MALTTQVNLTFQVSNGTALTNRIVKQLTETPAGTDFNFQAQSVTTGWSAVNIGSCASADYLVVLNNDASNYIQLATDSGGTNKFAKVTAGRVCLLEVDPSVTVFACANSAAVEILVAAVEP